MVNTYFDSIPVTDESEASVLGSPSGWEVLNELRDAGLEGRTAKELAKELSIPISTVYNALKGLKAAKFIKSRRLEKRVGRPSERARKERGKQERIYVENIHWGDVSFEDNFGYVLDTVVSKVVENSEIAKQCSDLIDKIITKIHDSSEKEFLPSFDICPICKLNHEANEFMSALVSHIAHKVLISDELEAVGKKYKYEI